MHRAAVLTLSLGIVAGCQKKPPKTLADIVEDLDFAITPRLPAPEAMTYASGEEPPRDMIIAELVRDLRHDGGLASAASGVALAMANDGVDLTRWELREALWRGGWPYPVFDARAWRVPRSGPPPRDLLAWLEQIPADEPMSLVRARGRNNDVWVGMRARPSIDLGGLPRVANLGTPVLLPAIPGATWRAADPSGALTTGTLDRATSLLLAATGEWLIDIQRDGVELARFPIYVGMDAPAEPLLRVEDPPPIVIADDADDFARDLLDEVRKAYERPAWETSPLFDAAVSRYVEDPSMGSQGALRGVGFEGSEAVVWACDAPTVQACLDTWLWDTRRRGTLLSESIDSYGLHTTLDAQGLHLTLLLVDAEDE